MEGLTIGEVANRVGVQPSALRYYESAGILEAPRRVNGQRRYDVTVLNQLAIIQTAQRLGFTVAEIRTLFYGFEAATPASTRWQTLAQSKLIELEALIRQAQKMKEMLKEIEKCGCLNLEECGQLLKQSDN